MVQFLDGCFGVLTARVGVGDAPMPNLNPLHEVPIESRGSLDEVMHREDNRLG